MLPRPSGRGHMNGKEEGHHRQTGCWHAPHSRPDCGAPRPTAKDAPTSGLRRASPWRDGLLAATTLAAVREGGIGAGVVANAMQVAASVRRDALVGIPP